MLSLIHAAIPFIASVIPLKMPSTTLPPHSSILPSKYSFALVKASPISPPMNAAKPPNAAPMASESLLTMPFQSMLTRTSRTFSPTCCQSVFSIATMIVSRMPLTVLLMACPASAASKAHNGSLHPSRHDETYTVHVPHPVLFASDLYHLLQWKTSYSLQTTAYPPIP